MRLSRLGGGLHPAKFESTKAPWPVHIPSVFPPTSRESPVASKISGNASTQCSDPRLSEPASIAPRTFTWDQYSRQTSAMDNVNIADLVKRLGSDEDPTRKMAAFKLQSIIGDPSFADVFIYEGGLPKLRWLALHATGNTLAYSLSSFSRLLELDQGWDYVTTDLIERVSFLDREGKSKVFTQTKS
jgi:hypothetical protein